MRHAVRILLALFCVLTTAVPVVGQRVADSSATLMVCVLDSTDAPLALADVILRRAGRLETSGPGGQVVLRNLPAGLDTLLVRRLGYNPLVVVVRFLPGDTLRVDAVLDTRSVALDDITVFGRPGLSTFERRMQSAVFSPPNSFYPPEALDTFPPTINVHDILLRSGLVRRAQRVLVNGRRQLSPSRLSCPPGPFGGPSYPVTIILNGIEYPDPDDGFFNIQLQNARIRALEIYRNNLEVPMEFSPEVTGRGCVVVVWSR